MIHFYSFKPNLTCTIFVLYIILMCSQVVWAQDMPNIRIYSPVEVTCGKWVGFREDKELSSVFPVWIRGFISGYNFSNPRYQIINLPDNDSIFLYIDKFCRENPLNNWPSAVFSLTRELPPAKLAIDTPLHKKRKTK